MNIVFLDGSPKTKDSTSRYLLDGLEAKLTGKATVQWYNARKPEEESLVKALCDSQALVVAFPLYVDSIPSHLLVLLEKLQDLLAKQSSAKVYVIVNSGFYEACQNSIALAMMEVWCDKAGLKWGQGVGAGAGGMAQAAPVGKGPSANMGKTRDILAENILHQTTGETLFTQPNFPRFLYKTMAHMGWRQIAKGNGIKGKEMYAKLTDTT